MEKFWWDLFFKNVFILHRIFLLLAHKLFPKRESLKLWKNFEVRLGGTTIDLIVNIDRVFPIEIDVISGFNMHTLKIQTITHTHTHTHTPFYMELHQEWTWIFLRCVHTDSNLVIQLCTRLCDIKCVAVMQKVVVRPTFTHPRFFYKFGATAT